MQAGEEGRGQSPQGGEVGLEMAGDGWQQPAGGHAAHLPSWASPGLPWQQQAQSRAQQHGKEGFKLQKAVLQPGLIQPCAECSQTRARAVAWSSSRETPPFACTKQTQLMGNARDTGLHRHSALAQPSFRRAFGCQSHLPVPSAVQLEAAAQVTLMKPGLSVPDRHGTAGWEQTPSDPWLGDASGAEGPGDSHL